MNINQIQKLVVDEDVLLLSYGGGLSQVLITGITETLENEVEVLGIGVGVSNKILTIFIELSQNIMNYEKQNSNVAAKGIIYVSQSTNGDFHVASQNLIKKDDKEIVEKKLLDIDSLDKEGIKKRYRELRKIGKLEKGKGGGIGFYEIAKKCDDIKYSFTNDEEGNIYFHIKTTILNTKEQ